MKTIASALALLVCTASGAQAAQIEPFECRQIEGPNTAFETAPAIGLFKPGTVRLICPFKTSMNGYRVHFSDQDGTGGNQSFKVSVRQIIDTGQPNSVPVFNTLVYNCDFRSNFHPSSHERADVACPVEAKDNTHQVFLIELWSRTKNREVIFYGIQTY